MKTRKLLAVLLALVMVMGMLPAGALGEEDLGTYECADVTLETSTGQFIDDVPVYIITLSKGYSGLLFLQNSNYTRVKLSGSGTINDNIATNAEITRESDRFNHAKEDYTQTVTGLITEKSGYDYLMFYAEKDDFDWTTFQESHVGVAYVIVEWEQTSGGGSDTPTSQYTIEADGITISYTASTEGSVKKIGTFEEMTMCGYSGDVYLVSLPCGTEITAIECPRSYGLTNYFGSGEMCLMYCEQNGGDALETVQEQLIYNEEFTDDQFIETHKYGYDGYGDLYSWITFDEVLPTNDVKGFAVYDADFYYWAGDGGTVVFIQISTSGGGSGEEPAEPTARVLPITDNISIEYTAGSEGTAQKIGTINDIGTDNKFDFYLVSFPYDTELTAIDMPYVGVLYGKNENTQRYMHGNANYPQFDVLLAKEYYLTDVEFASPPSGSCYLGLYEVISPTIESDHVIPTNGVTGYMVFARGTCYILIQIGRAHV